MKKYLSLFFLIAIFCNDSFAQSLEPNLKWGKPTEQELTMTEYADDKDADAVELYKKTRAYYTFMNGDFMVFYQVNVRMKVLKPEGKSVADEQIRFYEPEHGVSGKEKVVGLKATAYNMEGGQLVKTKMERSMIHEERLDKYQKVMKFSVPQVKVGTVIEYEYRIESANIYDIRDWNAQREIPVLYTCYELQIPEWFRFNIEATGSVRFEQSKKEVPMSLSVGGVGENISATEHTFIVRHLPKLEDDDFVWCPETYGNKVTAELSGIYVPGSIYKNYSSTWEDIDKLLMDDEDFGGRLKKSSPWKAEIDAAGIPAIEDIKERVAAVWKLLKSKVRWNGEYAFWGQPASKVLKEGTGTNADLNFILMNMLRDAGLEASPVVLRIRSHGLLPLTHASFKYLSTFVVGIQKGGSPMMFFDSSAGDGYLNVLPTKLLVDRARVIYKDQQGEWVNLQEKAQGRVNVFIKAKLTPDGKIEGEQDRMMVNQAALSLRSTWRQEKDSTETVQSMEQEKDIVIGRYDRIGKNDFSPTLKEHLSFTKQCDVVGGNIYLNPFILAQPVKSPFTSAERLLPVEFPYKMKENITVFISLPDGYAVEELPQPVSLKVDGISALVGLGMEDHTLKLQYQLNIARTLFQTGEYQSLKSYFEKLVECCKNIVTIKKVS